jgi:hypothetical protein
VYTSARRGVGDALRIKGLDRHDIEQAEISPARVVAVQVQEKTAG